MNDDNREMTLEEENEYISKQLEGVEEVTIIQYRKYSHWRIKQIFLEYFAIELRPYFMWYKAMRHRPCQQYVLVDMYTNETIGYERGYTLEQLRHMLSKFGFPLHDNELKQINRKLAYKTKRNKNAQRFLEIVDKI